MISVVSNALVQIFRQRVITSRVLWNVKLIWQFCCHPLAFCLRMDFFVVLSLSTSKLSRTIIAILKIFPILSSCVSASVVAEHGCISLSSPRMLTIVTPLYCFFSVCIYTCYTSIWLIVPTSTYRIMINIIIASISELMSWIYPKSRIMPIISNGWCGLLIVTHEFVSMELRSMISYVIHACFAKWLSRIMIPSRVYVDGYLSCIQSESINVRKYVAISSQWYYIISRKLTMRYRKYRTNLINKWLSVRIRIFRYLQRRAVRGLFVVVKWLRNVAYF